MFENVSKELLEKASKAKTKEEALDILKNGGVNLTDDDLEIVSSRKRTVRAGGKNGRK